MLKIIPVTALLSLAFLFPVQGFSQWRYDSIDRSLDRRGGSAAAPTKGPVVTNETARRTKEFRQRYGSRTRVYFLRGRSHPALLWSFSYEGGANRVPRGVDSPER